MRKRKSFNSEHSNTFAKALAEINVPEDYRRLQDSQAPGPSFESVEVPTEVTRRTPKSPATSSLVHGKWLKAPR